MITAIFGLPGAGKSSYLAYLAQRVQKGRRLYVGFPPFWRLPLGTAWPYERIYSNFPIAGCYKLNWDMIGFVDFSHCLILIDEIMHVCDSRDWQKFTAEKKYFFSMMRHYHSDMIYASQFYDDVDKKIRNLTEQILYIQNRGAFSRIAPIGKQIAIDRNIEQKFVELPPIQSSYILRKKYYHLFNSYHAKQLPENPALLWEVGK